MTSGPANKWSRCQERVNIISDNTWLSEQSALTTKTSPPGDPVNGPRSPAPVVALFMTPRWVQVQGVRGGGCPRVPAPRGPPVSRRGQHPSILGYLGRGRESSTVVYCQANDRMGPVRDFCYNNPTVIMWRLGGKTCAQVARRRHPGDIMTRNWCFSPLLFYNQQDIKDFFWMRRH